MIPPISSVQPLGHINGIAGPQRAATGKPGEFASVMESAIQAVDQSRAQANQLSVKLELQADCFAGVWARHADQTKHILEQGDVESALRAASAVGDDTLQRRSQGLVVPESFTHGSAAERVGWFKRGLTEGSIESCDTFSAPS